MCGCIILLSYLQHITLGDDTICSNTPAYPSNQSSRLPTCPPTAPTLSIYTITIFFPLSHTFPWQAHKVGHFIRTVSHVSALDHIQLTCDAGDRRIILLVLLLFTITIYSQLFRQRGNTRFLLLSTQHERSTVAIDSKGERTNAATFFLVESFAPLRLCVRQRWNELTFVVSHSYEWNTDSHSLFAASSSAAAWDSAVQLTAAVDAVVSAAAAATILSFTAWFCLTHLVFCLPPWVLVLVSTLLLYGCATFCFGFAAASVFALVDGVDIVVIALYLSFVNI